MRRKAPARWRVRNHDRLFRDRLLFLQVDRPGGEQNTSQPRYEGRVDRHTRRRPHALQAPHARQPEHAAHIPHALHWDRKAEVSGTYIGNMSILPSPCLKSFRIRVAELRKNRDGFASEYPLDPYPPLFPGTGGLASVTIRCLAAARRKPLAVCFITGMVTADLPRSPGGATL